MAFTGNTAVRRDRFGQDHVVVACKDRKGNGFLSGYVEIGKQLYKVEPGESNKDGVDLWIRVTKLNNRSGGGGGNRGRAY